MVRIRHFPDLGSVPFQATELPQAAGGLAWVSCPFLLQILSESGIEVAIPWKVAQVL